MRKLILIIVCISSVPVLGQVDYTYYTKAEVKEDLNFAFNKLFHIHPLLLEENASAQLKKKFLEIEENVKDSMTQNEVYLLLAPLFASLNDGHTGVMVPTDQRVEFSKTGGKSFPFYVDISNDSIYVSFYCGNDTSLFQNKEQILEINGIPARTMIQDMEEMISGESSTFKQKEIANKFRFLIWMLYGFENDYELVIKDNMQKIVVPGITSTEFLQNIKRMPKPTNNNYSLDINLSIETALMKIKTFRDLEGFCVFADSAFLKLKENKIKNLIIDIRNNGGGRSVVVDSLMNYLTYKNYAQYKKIEARISVDLKEYYEKRYSDRLGWINSYNINDIVVLDHNLRQPHIKEFSFDGNLFLLTNGLTYSAASTFTGVFKNLELGKIIGEETGGKISYFGDFWFLSTPNSKITFYVSPKRFIQYGGEDYNNGVIPDYIIADKGESIVNYVYKLIEK